MLGHIFGRSLGHCDRTCRLTCLEATNPAGFQFYRRRGVEIVGTISVDGSPVLTRLQRAAA